MPTSTSALLAPPSTTAFVNQVALVTGASGGIGGAMASSLAALGASVCLVGRDANKLEALTQRLSTTSRIERCPTDLTKNEDIERLTHLVANVFGRLDILIHAAGTIAYGKVEEALLSALDQQYAANVRGPYYLTQRLLPLLKKPRGQVVFVNSSVGLTARANIGQFSATQHACKALADALRDEINSEGVRVLSVFPGRTATPRMEALYSKEGQPYQPGLLLQPADVASVVTNALALPWTAEVTNISIRPMQKSY
jgi:NADP-dependent 3-hydroxy acid dehydrogenase YdfG